MKSYLKLIRFDRNDESELQHVHLEYEHDDDITAQEQADDLEFFDGVVQFLTAMEEGTAELIPEVLQ